MSSLKRYKHLKNRSEGLVKRCLREILGFFFKNNFMEIFFGLVENVVRDIGNNIR